MIKLITMDEKLFELSTKLKNAIQNDSRIVVLNLAEAEMENDNDAKILSYKMDCAVSDYNEMIRLFGLNSKETRRAQKVLYEAKKQLEELPSVRLYLEKYKDVRSLYEEINKTLFNDFNFVVCKDHSK